MNLVNLHTNKRKVFLFLRDENGNQVIKEDSGFHPYWYEKSTEGKYLSYDNEKLIKRFATNPRDIKKYKTKDSYEADVLFRTRYLIDRVPLLDKTNTRWNFIDIETLTKELPRPIETRTANKPISCVTFYDNFTKKYTQFALDNYNNEETMIEEIIKYFQDTKMDILLGWNISLFDFPYLYYRIKDFSKKISPIGEDRWGDNDIRYPAGLSIVDYLGLVKKIPTFAKGIKSYKLDDFMQHNLGRGKVNKKVDFSIITPELKSRNMEDVELLAAFEEKNELIPYYDEIRRFSKSEWEMLPQKTIFRDGKRIVMSNNSKVIEMLLFEEAKKKKVILPCKSSNKEKKDFQGAYREASKLGLLKNISKTDLGSAYPITMVDFNLSPENIAEHEEENTICINGIHFRQNSEALLPSMVKRLILMKNNIKNEIKSSQQGSEKYTQLKAKYDAIKSLVNTAYGVSALPFFRLYNQKVASTTTFLVRELLHYVKDKVESELKNKIVYLDTDSCFYEGTENIKDKLNGYIKQWSKETYGIESNIEFEYEGYFESILIIGLCHYIGRLNTGKGIEYEIKGVEAVRKDSSVFMAEFQETLINKILDGENKESILSWVDLKKEEMTKEPLINIAFPCKLNRTPEEYVNVPIFVRALANSKEKSLMRKRIGDLYYWLYIISEKEEVIKEEYRYYFGRNRIEKELYDEVKLKIKNNTPAHIVTFKDKQYTAEDFDVKMRKELFQTFQDIDVMAFDEFNQDHIKELEVNWPRMIERNINMKTEAIFKAMGWLNEEK